MSKISRRKALSKIGTGAVGIATTTQIARGKRDGGDTNLDISSVGDLSELDAYRLNESRAESLKQDLTQSAKYEELVSSVASDIEELSYGEIRANDLDIVGTEAYELEADSSERIEFVSMRFGTKDSESPGELQFAQNSAGLWDDKLQTNINFPIVDDFAELRPYANVIYKRENRLPSLLRGIASFEERRIEFSRGYVYSSNTVEKASIVSNVGKNHLEATNITLSDPVECQGVGGISPSCAAPPGDPPDYSDNFDCGDCITTVDIMETFVCGAAGGLSCLAAPISGPGAVAFCSGSTALVCDQLDKGVDPRAICEDQNVC